MQLFNSLTQSLEVFNPLEKNIVKMYSCGPTVYNNLHVGNLSSFVYADLLRRVLVASGYKVISVMNVTDVDDKTIRNSIREYSNLDPREALNKLTRKYEAVFMDDIGRIGNDRNAITFIRATESINEMIALTQNLLDNNIAYVAEDGIYFSIKNYEIAGYKYGLLQHIDRQHEKARVANDEYDKDSASDFALWKKTSIDEPSWPATFISNKTKVNMPGRPGWHIECSAMSEKILGIPFDIHTGGIDLKFPHHENEIAQSCGSSGAGEFAHYFIHNNHILIDGKKMSKSLGNFYTLRDIESRGYQASAFRLLALSSHYRSESNFTWEILDAAQNRLQELRSWADLRFQLPKNFNNSTNDRIVRETKSEILVALQNDLDTPNALAALSKLVSHTQNSPLTDRKVIDDFLLFIDSVFGLGFADRKDITENQKQLLHRRTEARKNKDWNKSDVYRDKLQEQGISINDTPRGQVWSRISD